MTLRKIDLTHLWLKGLAPLKNKCIAKTFASKKSDARRKAKIYMLGRNR